MSQRHSRRYLVAKGAAFWCALALLTVVTLTGCSPTGPSGDDEKAAVATPPRIEWVAPDVPDWQSFDLDTPLIIEVVATDPVLNRAIEMVVSVEDSVVARRSRVRSVHFATALVLAPFWSAGQQDVTIDVEARCSTGGVARERLVLPLRRDLLEDVLNRSVGFRHPLDEDVVVGGATTPVRFDLHVPSFLASRGDWWVELEAIGTGGDVTSLRGPAGSETLWWWDAGEGSYRVRARWHWRTAGMDLIGLWGPEITIEALGGGIWPPAWRAVARDLGPTRRFAASADGSSWLFVEDERVTVRDASMAVVFDHRGEGILDADLASDGGLYVGRAIETRLYNYDGVIDRVGPSGAVEATHIVIDDARSVRGLPLRALPGGGYVVRLGNRLARMDDAGREIWAWNDTAGGSPSIMDIELGPNKDSVFVFESAWSDGRQISRVVRLDMAANVLWFLDIPQATDFAPTSDGGVIVALRRGLTRIDAEGGEVWNNVSFPEGIDLHTVTVLGDGSAVVAGTGTRYSFYRGREVVLAAFVDAEGVVLWQRTILEEWIRVAVARYGNGALLTSGRPRAYWQDAKPAPLLLKLADEMGLR